jgi:hypothetical protein
MAHFLRKHTMSIKSVEGDYNQSTGLKIEMSRTLPSLEESERNESSFTPLPLQVYHVPQ